MDAPRASLLPKAYSRTAPCNRGHCSAQKQPAHPLPLAPWFAVVSLWHVASPPKAFDLFLAKFDWLPSCGALANDALTSALADCSAQNHGARREPPAA